MKEGDKKSQDRAGDKNSPDTPSSRDDLFQLLDGQSPGEVEETGQDGDAGIDIDDDPDFNLDGLGPDDLFGLDPDIEDPKWLYVNQSEDGETGQGSQDQNQPVGVDDGFKDQVRAWNKLDSPVRGGDISDEQLKEWGLDMLESGDPGLDLEEELPAFLLPSGGSETTQSGGEERVQDRFTSGENDDPDWFTEIARKWNNEDEYLNEIDLGSDDDLPAFLLPSGGSETTQSGEGETGQGQATSGEAGAESDALTSDELAELGKLEVPARIRYRGHIEDEWGADDIELE